jgi:hypothetical protein
MRMIATLVVAALLAAPSFPREAPRPGPEHELLAKRVGTWATTLKLGDMQYQGMVTYKMELGGLWLVRSVESDLGGQKFHGRSLETYDARKKKYVGVWFDSTSTTPMRMEGNFDPDKKTLTMVGEQVGRDGKSVKWLSVTRMPEGDTMVADMYIGGAKEPAFTITYRRKK